MRSHFGTRVKHIDKKPTQETKNDNVRGREPFQRENKGESKSEKGETQIKGRSNIQKSRIDPSKNKQIRTLPLD